ncbi:hypothetical protein [Streptomyces ochraceiscleroticus]|uniref:Lipoprotein n=1 Tax=Streptomyces ochraceiscleroticus TaxID=47761 RepID=A0ABW1MT09_9ACTN|nr:hypothetical protein [Streptomyces ochraceiscleroticus]
MNTATTATATNRFRGRGRAGRRITATIVVAAALGLGVTACGQGSGAAGAAGAGSSGSSTASDSPHASASAQPTKDSSSDSSASQGQSGGKSAPAPSTGSESAPAGGGVANAGNHRTIVGKLEYLAPGKLIVKPEAGGMDQAFFVANATKILGAAAICSDDPDDGVSLGGDGYGTAKCTVEQLEKAAKTSSVTVRVTMSTKSGAAETVEEKYHP